MTEGRTIYYLKQLGKLLILSVLLLFVFFQPAQAARQQQAIDCTTQVFVSVPECNALVALYNSTGGATWLTSTNWLDVGSDPCSWFGVSCSGTDVTGLSLPGNGLTGSLPVEIGNLTNLVTLDLSNNSITSSIPTQIGALTLLDSLDLSNNLFSGSLPTQVSSLTALINLDVSNNIGLTGSLPAGMTGMAALDNFDFSGTDLCEPQESAFQTWLSGLTVLNGTGISCQIDCTNGVDLTAVTQAECEALFALYNSTAGDSWTLSTNWLDNYDVCLWFGVTCGTGVVEQLSLPGNNLDGSLPNEIGDLTNLLRLDLSGNLLTGSIPTQIGNLTLLETLDFSDNTLTGALPSQIDNLTALINLDISNNIGLTGGLPDTMVSLAVLDTFDFSGTDLCEPQEAAFQAWLGGLTTLNNSGISCQIDCTNGEPSVPQAECEALFTLYADTTGDSWSVNTNWLTAYDVNSWSGVTSGANVTNLDLSSNNLDGTIPSAIEDLASLTLLDLSDNLLTGAVPGEIGNLAALVTLDISTNAGLTGSLPANMTSLGALTNLDFSATGLCEPQDIPFQTWLSGITYNGTAVPCFDCSTVTDVPQTECEALIDIYASTNGNNWTLATNWFSTDVCTWYGVICDVPQTTVENLIFITNNLTGTLPPEIGDFPNLTLLMVDDNPITGSIPSEVSNLSSLIALWIGDTNISGGLPSSLGTLSNLEAMWILNNQIDGNIPVSYGNLTNLLELVLDNNQLSGLLPTHIGNMVRLETLSVSFNNFSGPLPSQIGNLGFLQQLYINDNGFTGAIPEYYINLTTLDVFMNENNSLCLPTSLITWYEALSAYSTIVHCAPPSTDTPTPTATIAGTAVPPTSTSLPTNTPTITFTPTITRTPTLVFPLQTLTQMALEDTQAASGLRTPTSAATATLYYSQQHGTQTQAAINANATAESEVSATDTISPIQGGSSQGGSGFDFGGAISKLGLWGLGAMVFVGGGFALFLLMKRRNDEEGSSAKKKDSTFETFT